MVKKHVKGSFTTKMQSAILDFTHAHLMVILVDNVNVVNTKIRSLVLVRVKIVHLDSIQVRHVKQAVQHVQLVGLLVQVPPVAVHVHMESTKDTEVKQPVQHVHLDSTNHTQVKQAVHTVTLVNTNLVQVPPVAVHVQLQSTKYTEVKHNVQHVQLDATILQQDDPPRIAAVKLSNHQCQPTLLKHYTIQQENGVVSVRHHDPIQRTTTATQVHVDLLFWNIYPYLQHKVKQSVSLQITLLNVQILRCRKTTSKSARINC